MEYTVECRFGEHSVEYVFGWKFDADFDDLTDAVEYAAKECIRNPRMKFRIVRSLKPEELMVFPSLEEVQLR